MLERLWVVLVVLGYLGVGGLLFQLIEPPPPYPTPKNTVAKYTDACLNQLWIITERLNVLYQRNWTKLVTEELKRLEINVDQATRRDALAELNQQWSFTGSLLYSLTVITTIGGNAGPRTVEGKVATMVYALIGVPLMLACLTHLGSQLAELIESAYYVLCCCNQRGRTKETDRNERSEYLLEERGCGKLREVEVVRGSCGRAVCRLTSLDSLPDYPRSAIDSDDDELELSRGGRLNDTPSRVPLIWRGAGSFSDIPRRSATPPPSRVSQQTPPPPPPPSCQSSKRPPVPPLVSILLVTSYLCLGAYIFACWGRRSYIEGLYFTFTALTTIGLGELSPPGAASSSSATGAVPQTPGQTHGSRSAQRRHHDSLQLYLLAVSLYILVGLLIVATALALVHETLMAKTRQLATSLGMTKREELAV